MNRDFFYNWHKTVLKKHTTEVDVDAIWAAIEPEVDVINAERKRRRGFFFLLFSLSILILGVGYLSLFAPAISPAMTHITNTSNATTSLNKEGTQIDNNNTAIVITDNTAIANNLPSTKNSNSKTNSNSLTPYEISSSSKKVTDAIIQEKTRRISTPNTTSQIRLNNEALVTNTSTIEPIQVNNSAYISNKSTNSAAVKDQDVLAQERLTAVAVIDYNSINPLQDEEDKSMPTADIIIHKQNPFQFSLSLYSGIGFVNKSLAIRDGREAGEILLLRNATEKSLEVLNNGIKVGVNHKSGLNASVGFQYAKVAERFQYDTRFLEEDSISNQIIGYSNNLLGTQNVIRGSAPNNTLHDLEYDFYNNYHFLEIPISLGFQKKIKSWNVGLRASYIQNISLRTKGRVLNSSFEVINTTDDNELFKSNLAASLEGGINVGYRLTPHIAVGLETFYRYLPQSITKTDYSIEQNYNWIGLNASLQYSF